jgi:uncharacterized protein (DUF2235 family)
MSKNIALFSDGTGNSSAKFIRTNVWRVYEAVDLSGPDQIAYYDDGVGTSSFMPLAILGGALGFGLKRNVKHLYAFLSRNYEPGDRIFAFGFSRGAFTIRVLVDLIHDQGLARGATEADLSHSVDAKWWAYRKGARTRIAGKVRRRAPRRVSTKKATDEEVKFTFLGLWDTVDAYGLPVDELTRAWDHYFWPLSMNDRIASTTIEKAYHALSVDDERNTFHPVLWTEETESQNETSVHLDEERISQVWFAGVHSNVGGGYAEDSLAFVPLYWIIREAAGRGLRFQGNTITRMHAQMTPSGPIFDSRKGLGGYYRYKPRKIAELIKDEFSQVSIARPKIHESVFVRLKSGSDRYAPIILPARYAVVKADGSIVGGTVQNGQVNQGNDLESPTQSQARAVKQEQAWNWVWARRIVYFLAVASSIYLAMLPLIFKTHLDGTCADSHFCFLSSIIGAAASFLPDFASFWLDNFKSNPGWFGLGAILLAACLFLGGRIGAKIKGTMRLIWNPIIDKPNIPVPVPPRPSDLVYRLRTNCLYQAFFRSLTRYVLPFLFVLGIYYFGFALLSRATFSVASAIGSVCSSDSTSQTFQASSPCAATGFRVQEGARYRIRIVIGPDWADKHIEAGVEGVSAKEVTWPMYFALPFRRRLAEPWFKPVARIGETGTDEYPLNPVDPFPLDAPIDKKRELITEIQARRDGELFFYVNDALFLWPWFHTYGNNRGTATVWIQRVEAPSLPEEKAAKSNS